jgi:undecaprenyl-phosphate galactose phosphotransferase
LLEEVSRSAVRKDSFEIPKPDLDREAIAPKVIRAQRPSLTTVQSDVAAAHDKAVDERQPKKSLHYYSWMERLFDVLGATISLVLTLPLFLIVAVGVRMSGSPVIFSHRRIGRRGEAFDCYKFRSMVPDAERLLGDLLASDPEAKKEWERTHKLRNDPRVTRFGNFLRKSSLDELPQIFNVLKGDMSLVGPRPIVREELERYGNASSYFTAVRPGMTGLWQVVARSDCTYSRRVSLDKLYVKNKSIGFDIWLLWKTIGVVIKRVGAV